MAVPVGAFVAVVPHPQGQTGFVAVAPHPIYRYLERWEFDPVTVAM